MSARYANGSMSWCLQLPVKEYSTAAVRPPRSLPRKVQFFRLCQARHNRKNWLFAGSDRGGQTAAVLMSLCTTCKNLGIDPQAYLRDVLERISTHPARRIEELLPDRWQALYGVREFRALLFHGLC